MGGFHGFTSSGYNPPAFCLETGAVRLSRDGNGFSIHGSRHLVVTPILPPHPLRVVGLRLSLAVSAGASPYPCVYCHAVLCASFTQPLLSTSLAWRTQRSPEDAMRNRMMAQPAAVPRVFRCRSWFFFAREQVPEALEADPPCPWMYQVSQLDCSRLRL